MLAHMSACVVLATHADILQAVQPQPKSCTRLRLRLEELGHVLRRGLGSPHVRHVTPKLQTKSGQLGTRHHASPCSSTMGGAASSYSKPREVASKHFASFASALPSLSGRVVAITGCTSGTGLVTARTCARLGAHVLLLNRPSARAQAAHALVAEDAPGGVTSIDCDLQIFDSVRAAAAAVAQAAGEQGGLDVLCCNAGVMALADVPTTDGYDVQMQTNHLSHFLLAKELMPALEKAAAARGEARVVNHSSGARKMPGALASKYLGRNGGQLGGDGASMLFGGARWARYHQTKLANACFTLALADKLSARGSPVKALCAAPGLASTNLQVTTAASGGMAETWIMRYAQSAEDGTMPLLSAMLLPQAKNGGFYEPEGMTAMAGKAVSKDLRRERYCDARALQLIWAESEKACGQWQL